MKSTNSPIGQVVEVQTKQEVQDSPFDSSAVQQPGRPHILFLHQAPWFGGAEKRVLDWLRGIDYRKCTVTLTYTEDIFSARIKSLGLPVACTPLKRQPYGRFWRVFSSWLSYLRELRPDRIILVDGYFQAWPLPVVLAAYIVSRANLYMTEHTPAPEPEPRASREHFGLLPGLGLRWRFRMWQMRARARLCRRVVAVSEGLRQWMIRNYRYAPAKVVVAYHGVETSRFCRPAADVRKALRNSFGVPEDAILIVSTSRLHRQKGIERLIQAFSILNRNYPNLWLLIAGDGPHEAEVRRVANASDVSARIHVLGWLEDVSSLLQTADIYVLPSDFEGFGLALLEAMASELVCVATDTQGPGEVIMDGKNGFLVAPTDAGILEGLRRALQLNRDERAAMARSARQTVLERFSIRDGINRGLAALDISAAEVHAEPCPAAKSR